MLKVIIKDRKCTINDKEYLILGQIEHVLYLEDFEFNIHGFKIATVDKIDDILEFQVEEHEIVTKDSRMTEFLNKFNVDAYRSACILEVVDWLTKPIDYDLLSFHYGSGTMEYYKARKEAEELHLKNCNLAKELLKNIT